MTQMHPLVLIGTFALITVVIVMFVHKDKDHYIQDFAFSLLLGCIVGCVSLISLACYTTHCDTLFVQPGGKALLLQHGQTTWRWNKRLICGEGVVALPCVEETREISRPLKLTVDGKQRQFELVCMARLDSVPEHVLQRHKIKTMAKQSHGISEGMSLLSCDDCDILPEEDFVADPLLLDGVEREIVASLEKREYLGITLVPGTVEIRIKQRK